LAFDDERAFVPTRIAASEKAPQSLNVWMLETELITRLVAQGRGRAGW
jgi:hypothetical protein